MNGMRLPSRTRGFLFVIRSRYTFTTSTAAASAATTMTKCKNGEQKNENGRCGEDFVISFPIRCVSKKNSSSTSKCVDIIWFWHFHLTSISSARSAILSHSLSSFVTDVLRQYFSFVHQLATLLFTFILCKWFGRWPDHTHTTHSSECCNVQARRARTMMWGNNKCDTFHAKRQFIVCFCLPTAHDSFHAPVPFIIRAGDCQRKTTK